MTCARCHWPSDLPGRLCSPCRSWLATAWDCGPREVLGLFGVPRADIEEDKRWGVLPSVSIGRKATEGMTWD